MAEKFGNRQVKLLVSAELRDNVTGPDARYDSDKSELHLRSGRTRDSASPTSLRHIIKLHKICSKYGFDEKIVADGIRCRGAFCF